MSGLWVCVLAVVAVGESGNRALILNETPPASVARGASASDLIAEPATWTDSLQFAIDLNTNAARTRNLTAWKKYVFETLTNAAKLQATDLPQASTNVLQVYQELKLATQLRPQDRDDLRQQLRVRLIAQQQKLVERIPKQPAILAQQLPPAGTNAVGGAGNPGDQLLAAVQAIKPAQWRENGGPGAALLWQVGVAPGGGNGGFAFGQPGVGQNGGQQVDHGKELADLIQAVIAPNSWEANGGPGVIRYYAPARALVIRQTGNAHDQLNDLLNQLRRN